MQKLRHKHYNKQITTRDNDNVRFHDQKESKLNRTINVNKCAHTLTYEKLQIRSFNKDNVATAKGK